MIVTLYFSLSFAYGFILDLSKLELTLFNQAFETND